MDGDACDRERALAEAETAELSANGPSENGTCRQQTDQACSHLCDDSDGEARVRCSEDAVSVEITGNGSSQDRERDEKNELGAYASTPKGRKIYAKNMLRRLRWATLGRQYEWTKVLR
jgi:hypothetical protein